MRHAAVAWLLQRTKRTSTGEICCPEREKACSEKQNRGIENQIRRNVIAIINTNGRKDDET
jgi:hypothetical protein